jgi:hypothetical protein
VKKRVAILRHLDVTCTTNQPAQEWYLEKKGERVQMDFTGLHFHRSFWSQIRFENFLKALCSADIHCQCAAAFGRHGIGVEQTESHCAVVIIVVVVVVAGVRVNRGCCE